MYERTYSGVLGPYFAQVKEIAAGGNGRVLSAIDKRFDFPVCIKRISVANKEECRAALREIRIRRRLRHENIVGLLNAIVCDGTEVSEITPANFRDTSCIFLVQELLDADLRQVIESHGRLSDEFVKLFFYQLLRGLKYIHSANVLHRDLKPSNIMINVNSLQLMIGDFGHSMVLDPDYSHGNSSTMCDTSLWYKAPELILGTAQYSTASDVWAAGCVLAEMLLGRPLFEGENELEQLELIIHAIKVPQKDQAFIRTFLTDEVNTMYSGKPKFPLQSKFQKIDFQALHLLEHLLSFNSDDRVTAELVLSHPFLHEFSLVADEPVCLKPLHLEHEVDDFLEYTLKDLIVGECVALAEEQPRIHLQMSSYSSLNDLTKDIHASPTDSASQSTEERNSLELQTVSEDHHEELSVENESDRFKVLEVLKEEHGSSNDSNGLTTHEEGVSEAPLVLDHPMFSSSKWEKERHKSGHRRHHHHRRKKKFHLRNPSLEIEPSADPVGLLHEHTSSCHSPEVQVFEGSTPEHHLLRLSSPEEERCVSSEKAGSVEAFALVTDSAAIKSQDDKVHELILRSRQLIADKNAALNDVPAITDICNTVTCTPLTDVHISGSLKSSKNGLCAPVISGINQVCKTVSSDYSHTDVGQFTISKKQAELSVERKPDVWIPASASNFNVLHHRAVDLGVAEVIRKSQELLGDVYRPNGAADNNLVVEEKSSIADETVRVQDLIARSEQLLQSQKSQGATINQNSENFVSSESVKDLILKSEQLLQSQEIKDMDSNQSTVRFANQNVSIKGSTLKYEQPLKSEEVNDVNDQFDEVSSEVTDDDNAMKDFIAESQQLIQSEQRKECLQPVNESRIIHSGATEKTYHYPPPYTDICLNLTTQPILVDHTVAINPTIYSVPLETNILKAKHNDLYHLKQTDARMQKLLEQSHSLVERLKTEQRPHSNEKSTNFEELYGIIPSVETGQKENFDKDLNGVDLVEMKPLLDQTNKLLKQSKEVSLDSVEESLRVGKSENTMGDKSIKDNRQGLIKKEVDGNVKDFEGNEEFRSCIRPDSQQSDGTVEDVKDFSFIWTHVDFFSAESELVSANEQATVCEVKVIPPPEKPATHFSSLERWQDLTVSSDVNNSGGLGTHENNNHFHTRNDYNAISMDEEVSNGTVSENHNDNTSVENNRVISPDVNPSTRIHAPIIHAPHSADQNSKRYSELETGETQVYRINTVSLLSTDNRLIDDSEICVSENDVIPEKYSPKFECDTQRNAYSNTVIENLNPDQVVDKLCYNTCLLDSNTRNSKYSARLDNFYATLKIKSIMRSRKRPQREKRHDTYPF